MVDSPVLIVAKPSEYVVSLVIMEIEVEHLKTIFQRALNTWPEVPQYVLQLSDQLEKL